MNSEHWCDEIELKKLDAEQLRRGREAARRLAERTLGGMFGNIAQPIAAPAHGDAEYLSWQLAKPIELSARDAAVNRAIAPREGMRAGFYVPGSDAL